MSSPGSSRPRASDFLTELFRSPLDPGYAQAARRRVPGAPEPSGWRRGAPLGVRVAALVAIGFLLAVSYQYAVASQPEASRAKAGLVADVRARRDTTASLQERADKLRDDVLRERDAALSGGDEASRLRNLDAQTGLAKVRGDGVVVRLVDAPPPVDPVTGKLTGTNPGRVLDRDLQDISNELWRLGAEAVAINGERLTGTSTIRAAGDAILVDFRPVTAPYEVSAIGPGDLESTFADSVTAQRFRKYVDTYRMQFGVKQKDDMTLPAAAEPRLRHARTPAPETPRSASPVPSASGGGR